MPTYKSYLEEHILKAEKRKSSMLLIVAHGLVNPKGQGIALARFSQASKRNVGKEKNTSKTPVIKKDMSECDHHNRVT